MYLLYGFILTVTLATTSDAEEDNVIQLQKIENIKKLSSSTFSNYNTGHIIFNYFSNRDGAKEHLTSYHNLQYAGKISIGKPEQTFKVIYDLGMGDVMVVSSSRCTVAKKLVSPFCWKHKTYNEKKSTTSNMDPGIYPSFELVFLGGADFSGTIVYDTVKIGNTYVPATRIGVIEKWKNSFSHSKVDGIAGIANKKLSNFASADQVRNVKEDQMSLITERPTLQEGLEKKEITKFGFHFYKDKHGAEYGHLILGATEDENFRYTGEMAWLPDPPKVDAQAFYSLFWRFPIKSFNFVAQGNGKMRTIENKFITIADPGTSAIAGPPEFIDEVNKMLFRRMGTTKRSDKYKTLEFDCKYTGQLPILVFNMEDKGYILEPQDYIRKLRRTCTTGFLSVKGMDVVVIGDVFFHKYYTVFDFAERKIGVAKSFLPPIGAPRKAAPPPAPEDKKDDNAPTEKPNP